MPTILCLTTLLLQASQPVDPAPHRAQMITVADNVELEVLDFGGKGRPIVLLAGLGNTAHVFDDFAPKLTGAGRVVAITRRGYGTSTRAESGYDVARLGEDVLAVIDKLSLGKPALIGNSIAGQELSYLASRHRDRIAAVIYLEAAYRYAYDVPGEFERDFQICRHRHQPRPRRVTFQPLLCRTLNSGSPEGSRQPPRQSSRARSISPRLPCPRSRSSRARTML
jgi:pimeloyl-ACP methyl ester carboxylesterase